MKTEQREFTAGNGWESITDKNLGEAANLVLAFGGRETMTDPARFDEIRGYYPNATILTGSTAGEILDVEVKDDSISCTAIQFEHTTLKVSSTAIGVKGNSFETGQYLAEDLLSDDLVHIFVLSDGLNVNGSELVKGFNDKLPDGISVTGGLAGDKADFGSTLVGMDHAPGEGGIIAIGFYGDRLKVGYGSIGGWDSFGPERSVTKSKENV